MALPPAPVPVSLRHRGERAWECRTPVAADHTTQKRLLLVKRQEEVDRREAAWAELISVGRSLGEAQLSAAVHRPPDVSDRVDVADKVTPPADKVTPRAGTVSPTSCTTGKTTGTQTPGYEQSLPADGKNFRLPPDTSRIPDPSLPQPAPACPSLPQAHEHLTAAITSRDTLIAQQSDVFEVSKADRNKLGALPLAGFTGRSSSERTQGRSN